VQHREPRIGEGLTLLSARPPELANEAKLVFGVYRDAPLIAAVDLLIDFPVPGIWYLGLLLIDGALRGQGLGTLIYRSVARYIGEQGGVCVRLVVQSQNKPALLFWRRMGFHQLQTVTQRMGEMDAVAIRMEHELRPLL
jgi:ribosomal protein S18 acetylase RimI-like enzyme